jgi:hypothetical protein
MTTKPSGEQEAMREDNPQLTCSVLPFSSSVLAEPEIIRRAVCLEFSRQLFEYATLKDRDALQIIRRLQTTLNWAFRIERRIYMRRALNCQKAEVALFKTGLNQWDGPGPTATEDFVAATAHFEQGADLFEGLRRRSKAG